MLNVPFSYITDEPFAPYIIFVNLIDNTPIYVFIMLTTVIPLSWIFVRFQIEYLTKASDDFPENIFSASIWVIILIAIMMYSGALSAYNAINKNPKIYELTFNKKKIDVVFLRVFSEYFLVWHPDKKIMSLFREI